MSLLALLALTTMADAAPKSDSTSTQIAALQASVAALESRMVTLEAENGALVQENAAMQDELEGYIVEHELEHGELNLLDEYVEEGFADAALRMDAVDARVDQLDTTVSSMGPVIDEVLAEVAAAMATLDALVEQALEQEAALHETESSVAVLREQGDALAFDQATTAHELEGVLGECHDAAGLAESTSASVDANVARTDAIEDDIDLIVLALADLTVPDQSIWTYADTGYARDLWAEIIAGLFPSATCPDEDPDTDGDAYCDSDDFDDDGDGLPDCQDPDTTGIPTGC